MKPILFNTDMVRAILDGRKTVTRRVVKGYPLEHLELDVDDSIIGVYNMFEGRVFPVLNYAPYQPSDILYVRETWNTNPISIYEFGNEPNKYVYKADYDGRGGEFGWRPSIHMPKEAARIFLRVTKVRVERLQDITPEQVDAEGCKEYGYSVKTGELMPSSQVYFSIVWDSTIKPAGRAIYGWGANPWVWVIEFERISKAEAMA